MSDEEKRAYGTVAGTYSTGYGGVGCGAGCGNVGGINACDFCPDEFLVQVLCSLKGECVKVLTEADEVGIICGRLVTIGRDYIAVSCDGTVAYILLCQVTAIIPID